MPIECGVVFITKAGCDDFPRGSLRVGFGNPASRGKRIPHETIPVNAGEKQVFAPNGSGMSFLMVDKGGLISTDHIQGGLVRTDDHSMRPVLSSLFRELFEQGDLVEKVISIGVFDSIKPSSLVSL